jgi:two-component system, chemotaxis family, CheB/CheR fusion protein
MLEEAERQKKHPAIQIFASDLDEGALATAREGLYPKSIEADVSEERLARFFHARGAALPHTPGGAGPRALRLPQRA